MKKALCAILLLFLVVHAVPFDAPCDDDPYLKKWDDFSRSPEKNKLLRWAGRLIAAEVTGKPFNRACGLRVPEFYGRLGIFATIIKGRTVRGCYGAFSHASPSFEGVLADYLNGAVTRDPRSRPLDIAEIKNSRIIITITTQPYQVNTPNTLDLKKYGVTVECDGGTTVFVPAEILCTAHLWKYKRGGNCQYGAFRAVTMEGPLVQDYED